ncbi:MAG: 3-deoxy-D-manno-octulosonic acid transferase [Sedimentisphaerales bacterium]|nr:3-deoxy-D-manno-octulosonic acid transferase [Sedimentisphaerales bacterium]
MIYGLGLVMMSPLLLYRVLFQQRYRRGWKERFGLVPRRHSQQPCIWIHAVSMGEINAIGTLVSQIHRILPQFEVIISTTTDTGFNRARQLYGQDHRVFFYPWDFSFCVRKAFNRLHPQLCILMELEVWPNFTAVAQKLSIPVMVANGRISSGKGFPRYRRIAWLVRSVFKRLSLVLVQDESYARRFAFLGVPQERLQVVGSLKYDTSEITDTVSGADELARQLLFSPEQKIWAAGSTGPGEEDIILNSFKQIRHHGRLNNIRLVIVPRKPERFDEVARLIESHGYPLIRYSRVRQNQDQLSEKNPDAVILGDTMGDLRKFYSLAHVIFVGRSLVPMGGSDMMEAAGLARPVIVGPYTDNFMDTVKKLMAEQAIEIVADETQLTQAVKRLLLNKQYTLDMGRRARQVIIDNQGATQKSIQAIVKLLGYHMPANEKGIALEAYSQNIT